ncbi:helix-turn-helix transcriptional regulator [Thiorhodococcus minor]|uniref:Transcriptional regulator n=1 Tax=Thiorhodococcus minor TaxID=57489 RepID=A0A6M0K5D6_9GAMM|nr:transcriptional regulator [Thiorhodococcus minor]NEV64143.1 transcriptional regulator [Thiorhodococcus minor]
MQTHLARAAASVDTRAAIPEPFADDALVTQPQLKRLTGDVSDMTIWRWRRAGIIPEPTSIRGRNYWRAGDVRELLARLAGGAQ